MRPRFVGRLGHADLVTVTNAATGFVAVVAATIDPTLAARVVLVGAILDALDGIVARWRGSTRFGPYLDSLADVATFGVAPAYIVFTIGRSTAGSMGPIERAVWIAVPATFVATAVVRLALYTVLDSGDDTTEGVQTTLAATLVSSAILVGVGPTTVLVGTALLAVGMLAPVTYPDLRVRDAFLMGAVQALAIAFPTLGNRVFPTALLAWAIGYLVLSPRLYRRDEGKRS